MSSHESPHEIRPLIHATIAENTVPRKKLPEHSKAAYLLAQLKRLIQSASRTMAGSKDDLSELMKEYRLRDAQLEVKCTKEHLLEIGKTISWKAVGNHLLTEVELGDIEKECHSEAERRNKMLTTWKQKCGSKATYKVLIEAMLKAEKMEQAEGVCALISPPQQPPPPEQPSGAGASQPSPPPVSQKGTELDLRAMINFKGKNDTFNIFEQIGTHYTEFGIMLLEDKKGAKVAAIASANNRVAPSINREIIQMWLQGKGKQPVTWGTLVEVLEAIQLNVLARDIREALGF